jgi:hypothetical protein
MSSHQRRSELILYLLYLIHPEVPNPDSAHLLFSSRVYNSIIKNQFGSSRRHPRILKPRKSSRLSAVPADVASPNLSCMVQSGAGSAICQCCAGRSVAGSALCHIDGLGTGYLPPYSSMIHWQNVPHESSHFFLTWDFSEGLMQLCSKLHSARTLQPYKLMDCEPTIT